MESAGQGGNSICFFDHLNHGLNHLGAYLGAYLGAFPV